jgi:hypothetical protein
MQSFSCAGGGRMTEFFAGGENLINTPLQRGVKSAWRLGNRFNGFPACPLLRKAVISAHVFTFLLPRLVAPHLGNPGAQALSFQTCRCKALRSEELRRFVERYGLTWHQEETVETVPSTSPAPPPR